MKRLTIIAIVLTIFLVSCGTQGASKLTLDPAANYWQQAGDVAAKAQGTPALAFDQTGFPVVAVQQGTTVYVRRWNGSSWRRLGDALDLVEANRAFSPLLALESSGNPVVVWTEEGSLPSRLNNLYVKRWNGSTWEQLGGALNSSINSAVSPSLILDAPGRPTVTWLDGNALYVKQWNGSVWQQLGDNLTVGTGFASAPKLLLDSSGNLALVWKQQTGSNFQQKVYLRRWNGTDWQEWVMPFDTNNQLDIRTLSPVVNAVGNPALAIYSALGSCVKCAIVVQWNGSAWQQLPPLSHDPVSSGYPSAPWLVLGSSGQLVLSTVSGGNLFIDQWTGSNWLALGQNPLDSEPFFGVANPMLVNSNGILGVAWREDLNFATPTVNVYVKRYIENSWQPLGNALDTSFYQSTSSPVLGRKSDTNLVAVWSEADSVYVKEWTGTAWIPLGGGLNQVIGAGGGKPSLAIRKDGLPVVAWLENYRIYVQRWAGNWIDFGNGETLNFFINNVSGPSLALDSNDNPMVTWSERGRITSPIRVYVKKWDGSTWLLYGPLNITADKDATNPKIALDSADNPIVTWSEGGNVYVRKWNSSTNTWDALGGSLDRLQNQDALNPTLAIRSDGKPVVAWQENNHIYVKRWNGTDWISIGAALDVIIGNTALNPSIALGLNNNPVVTWQEFDGNSSNVYVKRWTGSAWTLVGSALETVLSREAQLPKLILKSDNNPIVIWQENDGISENIYVKQY